MNLVQLYGGNGPAWRWRVLFALGSGVTAAWSWQYGLVLLMQGPLAKSMNHPDFSWLSGSVVAGGLHCLLARQKKTVRPAPEHRLYRLSAAADGTSRNARIYLNQ